MYPQNSNDERYEPPTNGADDTQGERYDDDDASTYRSGSNDPAVGYLIAIALAIGLTPSLPESTDVRFTLVWIILAGFGVLAWLLGNTTRIGQEKPENLAWGVVFGLLVGAPILLIGSSTLGQMSALVFRVGEAAMPIGVVLALLVFAMPTAETLFFRGVFQENRPFWLIGILSSVWSLALFLPLLDVGQFPAVAVIIAIILVLMNMIYSYVRQRNGLAAAWLCQITLNLLVFFLPYWLS
jgi:hypothetical protein